MHDDKTIFNFFFNFCLFTYVILRHWEYNLLADQSKYFLIEILRPA